MPYQSGEFHPPDSGDTTLPGSAVFFDGVLYYFNRGDNSAVYVAACSDPDGNVREGWTNEELPEDSIGTEVVTDQPPVAVACGGYLYLFWVDNSWNKVCVTRAARGADGSLTWSTWSDVSLQRSATADAALGDPVGLPIAACAMGDATVVLCMLQPVGSENLPWYLTFDTADYTPGSAWITGRGGTISARFYEPLIGAPAMSLRFESEPMSLTWYSAGGDVDPTDDLSQNTLMLGCAVTVSGQLRYVAFALQLTGTSVPVLPKGTNAGYVFGDAIDGVWLQRDPGGRVRAFYQKDTNSPHLITALFDTSGAVPVLGTPSMVNGVWAASDTLPVNAYSYSDPVGDGNVRVVREWVLYTAYDDGEILCQVAEYGTLERVPDTERLDLTAVSRQFQADGIRALTGYIDGPVPVPQVNVSADPSKATGAVTYGWTKQQGVSNTVSQHMTIGVKSEGKASLGAGAAWELSMSGGVGASFGDSTVATMSTRQTQLLAVDQGQVSPRGTLFAGSIVVHRDAYTFTPAGASEPAEDAPIFTTFYAELVGTVARSFEVFTTTPGDLESYKPDAWNQRMKDAGFGDDYLETWIYPNALPLDADGVRQPYLPFSWSDAGNVQTSFGSTTTSFDETSWTFETSVYAGATFSFFGIAEATFMAGWTFDTSTTKTTMSGESWGIDASFTVPAAASTPGAALAYDFQLYFLPANRQWANEFFALCADEELKASLDPSSSCWKIVYVVTAVLYNDSVDVLVDHGLAPPLLAALKEQGLRFTGELMRRHGVSDRASARRALRRDALRDGDREVIGALERWITAAEWRAPEHHRRPRPARPISRRAG